MIHLDILLPHSVIYRCYNLCFGALTVTFGCVSDHI